MTILKEGDYIHIGNLSVEEAKEVCDLCLDMGIPISENYMGHEDLNVGRLVSYPYAGWSTFDDGFCRFNGSLLEESYDGEFPGTRFEGSEFLRIAREWERSLDKFPWSIDREFTSSP